MSLEREIQLEIAVRRVSEALMDIGVPFEDLDRPLVEMAAEEIVQQYERGEPPDLAKAMRVAGLRRVN